MSIGFNTQRNLLRNVVVSAGIQTDFAQTFDDADLTEHLKIDPTSYVKFNPEMQSDVDQAGKGHSSATESDLIAISAALDLTTRANDWNTGWALMLVMGNHSATNAVGVYTHTFKFEDSQNNVAKVSNMYIEDTNAIKYKLLDVAGSTLTLTSTAKGAMDLKLSLMGTGRTVDGAMGAVPAIVARQRFYGSDTKVKLGPVGAPLDFYPRVLSWEIELDRGTTEMRVPGNGTTAAFLQWGNPKPKVKLVIAADSTDDVRAWQRAGTPLELQINTTSGPSQINFKFPKVILPADDFTDQNGSSAYSVQLDENTILRAVGQEVATATLVNGIAAYGTVIAPPEED
ncbi:phage tail tube protein [Terriglobus sp. RCC_193]|uniref:phage tail tube protein n=1 Tax=Terriglobus sp. RCC_193 TaxID=3239218 RepID=UPI00352530D1